MNEQNFTEKTATFSGEYFNLRAFLNSGIIYSSRKKISEVKGKAIAKVTWICEDSETDIHDLIDIEQVELWGVDIIGMNN